MLALAAVIAAPTFGGCEGCDFSFGAIPLTISLVEPLSIDAQFVMCREDDPCVDLTIEAGETVVETWVGWQGYLVCRQPMVLVRFDTPDCDLDEVVIERSASEADPMLFVEFDPLCASIQ